MKMCTLLELIKLLAQLLGTLALLFGFLFKFAEFLFQVAAFLNVLLAQLLGGFDLGTQLLQTALLFGQILGLLSMTTFQFFHGLASRLHVDFHFLLLKLGLVYFDLHSIRVIDLFGYFQVNFLSSKFYLKAKYPP